MPLITTATGTYEWVYGVQPIPYNGNYSTVDAYSLSQMALARNPFGSFSRYETLADAVADFSASGAANDPASPYIKVDDVFAPTNTLTTNLVATGASYDSGTVQIYAYVRTSSFNTPTGGVLQYSAWIYYAPIDVTPDPPPSPTPITLDLDRTTPTQFFPESGQEDILTKYKPGVEMIRAKFQGTRTAVIINNNLGGFILYEEVGGVPSGDCYVYNYNRTLKDIIQPADLGKYTI